MIIGGGPTGVEFSGALAELLFQPLATDFPELRLQQEARVILLEAAGRLLQGVGGDEYAQQRLTKMGVDVRLNSAVAEISDSAVILASGERLATACLLYTSRCV